MFQVHPKIRSQSTKMKLHYTLIVLNDEVSDLIESYLAYDDLLNGFNDLYDKCKLVGKNISC